MIKEPEYTVTDNTAMTKRYDNQQWMPKGVALNIKQFLICFRVILINKQTFLSTVRILISKIVVRSLLTHAKILSTLEK